MQRKVAASKAFIRDTPAKKITFGTAVIAGLGAIPSGEGPTLPYAITLLQAANTKLINTAAEAATGSHAGVSERNAAEKDWNTKFGATADAVSEWAEGDAAKIQHAGFIPTKAETTPAPLLHPPTDLRKTPGYGAVAVSLDPPDNGHADAYVWVAVPLAAAISRNGDTICINIGGQQVYVHVDTHPAANLEGLTPNVEVQIMAVAVNSAGTSDMSSPVQATPQSQG